MADQKITALTENTAPLVTDIMPMVDDPGSSPATQKMTLQTLLNLMAVTSPINADSMARQAIMNGNFDVWQRGVSFTDPASGAFTADRMKVTHVVDGGTFPTVVHSREAHTPGDLSGSFYFYRVAPNGAGTNLGNGSYYFLKQTIEHGTRFLCGAGKTVTLSFYARSSIANKKLGLRTEANMGTGGTPSGGGFIAGEVFTLTSSWVKYTHTFACPTLVDAVFGTANNDFLTAEFFLQWGSSIASAVNGSGAETFVGSGNIDISQVQFNAGSVALPFQPKTYDEELRACQRYCYVVTTAVNAENIAYGHASSTTVAYVHLFLPVEMRAVPSITATAADWQLDDIANAPVDLSAIAMDDQTYSNKRMVTIKSTVASGLTANRAYYLVGDGTPGRVLILSAEI